MRTMVQWIAKSVAIAIAGALLVTLPTAASAQQPRHRVIVIQRVPAVDPFFPYAYPDPPNYLDENYGYVKIDTHRKDASVYVDGGYADKIEKNKKFALRPGTHDFELRDSDGRKLLQERVAIFVDKTTKLPAPS